MSHSYDSDFDRLLDQLRSGQMSAAGSEEILRAADELHANKALPSEAFKDELEVHLRSYAASNPGRPGLGLRSRFRMRRTHRSSDRGGLPPLLRARNMAVGMFAVAVILVCLAVLTSSGRATARDVAHFVGITSSSQQAPEGTLTTTDLPLNIKQLEQQVGFTLRLPAYLPEDLQLKTAGPLPASRRLSGAQFDYVNKESPDSVVLSLREFQVLDQNAAFDVPGEPISIAGNPAILSRLGGAQDFIVLQWVDQSVFFELSSSLPVDQAIRVAESI